MIVEPLGFHYTNFLEIAGLNSILINKTSQTTYSPSIILTKGSSNQCSKKGSIKLYPEAVLGLFPMAGSYLVPDYLELNSNTDVQDIGSLFTAQKLPSDDSEFKYISTLKEEQTVTPFKLDAFQENALKAIKSGKSVVIQGPPGQGNLS